ncbi:hypothetical protein BD310DRAFT_176978 [Dichomitus squalens]|uniref:Uncharacterized protein n=1 Tax=Dichomitus squalens TaxID=114155 RepID=A0A4Q9Q3T0_9APHY|nr:hypothetical protein BD310DRAFT_176978 [Dichomitus squalens]
MPADQHVPQYPLELLLLRAPACRHPPRLPPLACMRLDMPRAAPAQSLRPIRLVDPVRARRRPESPHHRPASDSSALVREGLHTLRAANDTTRYAKVQRSGPEGDATCHIGLDYS